MGEHSLPIITTVNLCVLFQERSGLPQFPLMSACRELPLLTSGRGGRDAQTPGREGPCKEHHKRQQDGIAVAAIERVRMPKQLRRTANQGSGSHDEKAAQNVK